MSDMCSEISRCQMDFLSQTTKYTPAYTFSYLCNVHIYKTTRHDLERDIGEKKNIVKSINRYLMKIC